MSNCAHEDCQRAVAPVDGKYCSQHSQKLANPYSSKLAKETFDTPASAIVAKNGIHTSSDFANFMGALMGDLVSGKIEPGVADAAVRVGDSLLRVVEMRLRHGFKTENLELADNSGGLVQPPEVKISEKK